MRTSPYILSLFLWTAAASATPPAFEQVKADWRPSEAWLLDRHGVVVQELRLDTTVRRTEWTALADISPAMTAATILAEDKRFFRHEGVDWLAATKAALTNWLAERPRGASTISMQLVGLLDPAFRASAERRSVPEKWRQMQAAQTLEDTWTKAQIIEAYFNLLSFRGDLVGIDAAARALFDKRPAGLGTAEALILAALIRSPHAKPDRVAQRACALAEAMPEAPSCETITALTRNSLTGRLPILPSRNLAPHLARKLLTSPGQRLVSSLDAHLQTAVRDILAEQLERLAGREVGDAAALVLDNRSGDVLAYVSLSGRDSASPESDGVDAHRQAGSTLKPFLYALAVDSHHLTAASPLEDTPLAINTPGGGYAPDNYDNRFRGLASVRRALAGSLNIPAVRTIELIGADAFAQRLADLGFSGLTEEADFYGPALALGSLDVSLWELVNAYRTLANRGRHSAAHLRPEHATNQKPRQLYGAPAAFIIADILADREARATTFGLENALSTRYWSAVKTGTSKDMRDNWCIGFSGRYTVGVWVGNLTGDPMRDVSGVSGAAPAWRLILDHLHASTPSQRPEPPAGLVSREIQPPGEAPRREWFIAGTEPATGRWAAATPPAAIVRPADGEILALDPDIPASHQRLTLKASSPPPGARWRMNGQLLTDTAGDPTWPISRGHHLLILEDAAGTELDRAEFQVR